MVNIDRKKYYFKEVKPKLLKKKSKPDKSVMDICYFITEKFDEWLHFKQKIIKYDSIILFLCIYNTIYYVISNEYIII